MLLDPLEKQFNMPAIPIQFTNGHGGKREVVCYEDQFLVTLLVPILYCLQRVGEILYALFARKLDCPVADKSCGTVHLVGVNPAVLGVLLGSQNEEAWLQHTQLKTSGQQ